MDRTHMIKTMLLYVFSGLFVVGLWRSTTKSCLLVVIYPTKIDSFKEYEFWEYERKISGQELLNFVEHVQRKCIMISYENMEHK